MCFQERGPRPNPQTESANVSGASLEVSVLGRGRQLGTETSYPNLRHPTPVERAGLVTVST